MIQQVRSQQNRVDESHRFDGGTDGTLEVETIAYDEDDPRTQKAPYDDSDVTQWFPQTMPLVGLAPETAELEQLDNRFHGSE